MNEILSRLFALLRRETEAFQRLHENIVRENQCLLTRNLAALQDSLKAQKRIMAEIGTLDRARQAEYENLSACLAAQGNSPVASFKAMHRLVPLHERRRWIVLRERLKRLIQKARVLNTNNQKLIEISRDVFAGYLNNLAQLSAIAGGYDAQGLRHPVTGSKLLDQRS
jgi:hypothetical protein